MGKLCFNQNRGVYEWVHVNPTSTVFDLDNVAYELSNDPLRPEMKVTTDMLGWCANHPGDIYCNNCHNCIYIGKPEDPSATGPDKDGDGQLSPTEAADVVEELIDMSTGELKDSSMFREIWTTL